MNTDDSVNPDDPDTEAEIADTTPGGSAEVERTMPPRTRSTGEWRSKALCAQLDPEVFFPNKGVTTATGKKICSSCEVRSECLSHALENGEHFGIWGGLSARERKLLRPGAPLEGEVARRRRDDEVMKLLEQGRNAPSIARVTGLNERTVHRIINRAGDARKSA